MKKTSNILWGIVLVAVGAVFALNALDVTDIDVFFDGWWTLFIIVPCTIGLFTEQDKIGNIIGIAIGVFLLLSCQNIIKFEMLWKLLIPAVIIIIGLKLVFGGLFDNKSKEITEKMKEQGKTLQTKCAVFSGEELKFDGEVFDGAEFTAVFGGIKCDLKNAVIDRDVIIKTTAIFGGIDIFVSDNVNVKINSTSIFGGMTNKTSSKQNVPTIYVSGVCLFGGVDVK